MDKDSVLYEPCDVLVPAAIGNVITSDNASKLNCQYVVEAANGPTTPNVRAHDLTTADVTLQPLRSAGMPSCNSCKQIVHDVMDLT